MILKQVRGKNKISKIKQILCHVNLLIHLSCTSLFIYSKQTFKGAIKIMILRFEHKYEVKNIQPPPNTCKSIDNRQENMPTWLEKTLMKFYFAILLTDVVWSTFNTFIHSFIPNTLYKLQCIVTCFQP